MIRKLIKNDRDKIREILIETNHFDNDEIKIALELIDIYLNDKNQMDYIIYVYEDDETKNTIGYICYGKRPMTVWTYDLYWIAVDPSEQGKGIGNQLIEYMENELLKLGGKIVLVETSGKPQYEKERKFYTKSGYEVQTIIKDFYREGDDLFIYRKDLLRKSQQL